MPAADVTTQHPEYEAMATAWQRCRDLRAGSDAVKAGAYLPQSPGMSSEDFTFYRDRAQYFNCFARTVQALSGAVFARAPIVKGVPAALQAQLEDLTMRDEPLDVVAGRIVTELLDVGRYAILVEMPVESSSRPYWATLAAESVINWKTAKAGADPEQLVLAVVRQDVPASDDPFSHAMEERYKELALIDGVYQARVWTAVKGADGKATWTPGPWLTPTRRGEKLPFIPLAFVSVEGITPDVTRPPLLDLADVSIGHYRNSADHEHVLFWVACPTPWVSGAPAEGAPLKIGSSIAWSLDKDGHAGMLEISGQGIAAIKDAMAAKERQMAALGARMLEDPSASGSETATAVRMRHSGDTSSLKKIAQAASAAITRVLRWHVWWAAGIGDIPLDVSVKLCDDFATTKATPDEVRTAFLAVQGDKMSFETFYELLQRGGWAREGVTAEDELAAIERGAPPLAAPEPDEPVQDPPPPATQPPALAQEA